MSKNGFFIVELLFAIAVLSGVALLVCRFQWVILQIQEDALLAMRAIDRAIEHLEVVKKGKKEVLEGERYNFSQKIVKINVLNHNLPKKIAIYKEGFDAVYITTKWTSLAATERSVELFAIFGEKND